MHVLDILPEYQKQSKLRVILKAPIRRQNTHILPPFAFALQNHTAILHFAALKYIIIRTLCFSM